MKKQASQLGQPTVIPGQGIQLLRRQIERGEKIRLKRPIVSTDYEVWENATTGILEKCFGIRTRNVEQFEEASRIYASTFDTDFEALNAKHLQKQLALLESYVDLLETELSIDGNAAESAGQTDLNPVPSGKVFLVHGRDEAAREATARFLEKLQLTPIILHEQPNKGRTIIEKFSDYSDVGFSVVLLTGDDRGGLKDDPFENQKLRARQNVLFELGFFLGKLSRSRVCALYQDGVEIPSDYQGVIFIKLDERGAWKLDLAREIKAAGFAIDMNRAL